MHPQSITSCASCGGPLTRQQQLRRRRYCSPACAVTARCVPTAERFWPRVEHTEGCWLWTGGRNYQGYGVIYDHGHRTQLGAHRMSWELHYGPIPDGLWVLHRCDNPPCVRPDHLFLGDHAANMADMTAKGRARNGRAEGERNAYARLTATAVLEIRRAYAAGEASEHTLARQFGVGQSTISDVLTGRTWSHLLAGGRD